MEVAGYSSEEDEDFPLHELHPLYSNPEGVIVDPEARSLFQTEVVVIGGVEAVVQYDCGLSASFVSERWDGLDVAGTRHVLRVADGLPGTSTVMSTSMHSLPLKTASGEK